LLASDQQKLHQRVARRWLQELDPNTLQDWWLQKPSHLSAAAFGSPESLHAQRLLENMYDGVIFLGPQLQVLHWNRGTERLTGIAGSSMLRRPFVPSVLRMRDEHGAEVRDDESPVAEAMRSGVQSLRRLVIRTRRGQDLLVNMHIIPIVAADGCVQGASLLVH